jgi:hypothetical protein
LACPTAIGILGVNLIYAASYQLATKESFLSGLAQDVKERIEIDFVDFRGPAFDRWDLLDLLAYLVHSGLAKRSASPLPSETGSITALLALTLFAFC